MRRRLFLFAPLILVAFLLFIALGGVIVQQLWNWLAPGLFGWREVTFWQALGLLALCRILFGGFGSRGFDRSGHRLRWEHMTPEERQRFRQGLRRRFGLGPAAGESEGQ